MRCFKHPDKEAVGLCKVCEKGLCHECAVEVDDFLFCRPHSKMDRVVKHAEREALGELEGMEDMPARAPRPTAAPSRSVAAIKPVVYHAPMRHRTPKYPLQIPGKSLVTPAVVGGMISGTPSGIPFLNFACLIWMVLGGIAAGYLLLVKINSMAGLSGKLKYKDGAFVGALSGVFGASIAFVFSMFSGVNFWQPMLDLLTSNGVDYSVADLLLRIIVVDPQIDILPLLAKWLLLLAVFPVFGALGGIIAAKLSE